MAARRSDGETLRVTFDLTDVSGTPISDPETFFTFRRLTGNRQIGDQLQVELTGASIAFNVPVAAGEVYYCEIDPKRYRFAKSPVFFATPGEPVTRTCQLLREPEEWKARYTPWNELPPSFDALKAVLHKSSGIVLLKSPERGLPDPLIEDAYDDLSREEERHAKTALLNICHRLNNTVEPISNRHSWFSFVKRIIAIDRERFLAFVDGEMETLVRTISDHIEQFRAEYERTPAENHRNNVPQELRPRITSMVSIKSSHAKGNFQLTLAHLSGPDEVLLDADIDESGDLLGHTLDVFRHKRTGGTHPHDIHELLVLHHGVPEGELGYRLV